jgi:hypothetical protein
MKTIRNILTVTFIFLFVSVLSEDINAQDRGKFGVRTGIYTDFSDLFVGVEYLTPVSQKFYLNPNLEHVFIDNGSYWTLNMDAHYDFHSTSNIFVWTGGGVGILHAVPDGSANSNTDFGINLLIGMGFNLESSIIPYLQGKAIVSDNTDFEIGLGVRF